MAKVAVGLLIAACCAGVVAPPAAADEPRANVVSWAPNDVRPGEPVSIELSLSGVAPAPVGAVEVVIRGDGVTRRFPTDARGSGRYRTEIVFPKAGSWRVLVGYGDGEVPLGKGAICVAAVCVGPQPDERAAEPAGHSAWWWIGLGSLGAARRAWRNSACAARSALLAPMRRPQSRR